jgi:FKBP-type peptidyl-prolyl cis-trans isomerase FklB
VIPIRDGDCAARPRLKDTLMKSCRAQYRTLMLALVTATTAYGSPTISPGVVAAISQATSPTPSPATTPSKQPAVSSEVGSYDIGLLFGSQLQHNGVVPNLSQESLIRGLKEAVGGRPITNDEREAALNFMRQAHGVLAEKNRAAGREFLAHNAKEPGVVTLPSGLQYRVLAEGDPKSKPPAPTDEVTVRYRATLADGTEIDRSDSHGIPASFRVNSVFKAWQEAFAAMKPGATWQLFVPPELGYGNNPPPTIPPGAVLVYELELLKIDPRSAMPTTPAAPVKPATGSGAPHLH